MCHLAKAQAIGVSEEWRWLPARTKNMADLPFLVAHGTVVWQALVAASVVLGGVSASFLVHRAMRARAARVRAALGKPSPEARVLDAGQCVTLEGTLELLPDEVTGTEPPEGGDAVVTIVPQGLEQSDEAHAKARSATARGARLALDVAGTRVVLDGAVQVLAGSRETERCVGKAQALALLWDFAGTLGALPPKAFAIRALAAGDRVRARGVLRHEPAALEGDSYRTGRAAFALEVDREDPELPLIALAAASRPRPLVRSWGRTALRALPIPLAMVAALAAVGEIGVRTNARGGFIAASATPFRRADALGLLRADIDLRFGADAPKVAQAVAYDLVRGRCGDAADDTFAHHDLSASARISEACGDPLREARAYFAQADFDRAAERFAAARKRDPKFPPTLTEATAYVASGRRDAAAVALRALGKTWEDSPHARERFECAALAIEALGDHPEVAVNLEERAGVTPETPGCLALAADVLHGEKRLQLARRHNYWGSIPLVDWRKATSLVALEEVPPDAYDGTTLSGSERIEDLVFDPRRGLYTVPPGLAESLVKTLAARHDVHGQQLRGQLLLGLARLDSYLGAMDEAHARVHEARAAFQEAHTLALEAEAKARKDAATRGDGGDGDGYPYDYGYGNGYGRDYGRDFGTGYEAWRFAGTPAEQRALAFTAMLDAFDFALDVRAGTARDDLKSSRLDSSVSVARSAWTSKDPADLERLARRDTRDINQRLWALALEGDGPGLTRKLDERGLDGRGVVDYLRTRPQLSSDLSRWVRHGYPTTCVTCGLYPLANHIASRRDAAGAAGATDVVTETTLAAKRIRTLLLRRDIAIPLAVISELSPP